ncbi:MBL fold metallo-hydrolase [candidate division KSB1 bacterium]
MILLYLLGFVLIFSISVLLFLKLAPQFGGKASGESMARILRSPNYKHGKFVNSTGITLDRPGNMFKALKEFLKGGNDRVPAKTLPFKKIDINSVDRDPSRDLRITWIGHSTVLIEIDGYILLTDPMFGNNASPVPFFGVKRFNTELPVTAEELPEIDAVLLTHDHYDHLDHKTILKIKDKVRHFYTPLGVGAHLERWGVSPEKISEFDWWEEVEIDENILLAATPACHFSGRSFLDRFETLWCSWVIKGKTQTAFFGGDSGYFNGFKQIGDKYGPFDISMLESGAYSIYWPDIHMMPEETVQAHQDLSGKILMPIHWGSFNLSIHSWTEPIERLMKKAESEDVAVTAPVMGESFFPADTLPVGKWWK